MLGHADLGTCPKVLYYVSTAPRYTVCLPGMSFSSSFWQIPCHLSRPSTSFHLYEISGLTKQTWSLSSLEMNAETFCRLSIHWKGLQWFVCVSPSSARWRGRSPFTRFGKLLVSYGAQGLQRWNKCWMNEYESANSFKNKNFKLCGLVALQTSSSFLLCVRFYSKP